jgi:hypothetical protein
MHSSPRSHRWLAFALPALALAPLAAQHGAADVAPPRAAADVAPPRAAATAAVGAFDQVLHDDVGAVHWASGRDWKASFDRGGFTFVPCLGAKAPRNFPVAFAVVAVRVGGRDLAFAGDVAPRVHGDRVVFERGGLRELYDLQPAHVEQSFVVDARGPGDVEVELRVDSELREDADRAGLQFANEFGAVAYGEAFLVRDGARVPIATTFADGLVRLRVPAALRGDGPVVIDPIINTDVADYLFALTFPSNFPDLAYQASSGRFLAVWERTASATDRDVLSQMLDVDGDVIPNSGAIIDISPIDCRVPRVASLGDPARFLVVYERTDPAQWGGRTMIYGRIRQADGLVPLQPEFQISQANWNGVNGTPDVGGDPLPTQTAHGWLVVWTHTFGNAGTIHRRAVRGDGVMTTQDDELLAEPGHGLYSPQVSLGNGNGQLANPGWLVVCSRVKSPGDTDVTGVFVTPGLAASAPVALDHGTTEDWYAFVSSPATDVTGTATRFLVTYERQSPQRARALVFDATTGVTAGAVDLTQAFGIGPVWTRGDSDGTRFVIAASTTNGPQQIEVSTLAFDGQTLWLQEWGAVLQGSATFPQVVGDRAAGGSPNRYAVVYQDVITNPSRTRIARYEGYASGPQVVRRQLACHGLVADFSGRPLLGEAVQFSLTNVGAALPGFAIGMPSASPVPLCTACSVGMRLDLPVFLQFGSPLFALSIPGDVGLVGAQLTVQGLSVGAGSCVAGIAVSDAFDVTVR